MSADVHSTEVALAVARTWLVLLLIGAYRLGRCAVASIGLAHWLGASWAIILVLLAAMMRWTLLLQIGAALTLILWWRWPALLALIVVAPRLFAILPGLIRTWGASVRHPRTRWNPTARADGGAISVPAE